MCVCVEGDIKQNKMILFLTVLFGDKRNWRCIQIYIISCDNPACAEKTRFVYLISFVLCWFLMHAFCMTCFFFAETPVLACHDHLCVCVYVRACLYLHLFAVEKKNKLFFAEFEFCTAWSHYKQTTALLSKWERKRLFFINCHLCVCVCVWCY